jgi:hypothetical protein
VRLVEKTPERGTVQRWAGEDGRVGVHNSKQWRCLWFGCAASSKQLGKNRKKNRPAGLKGMGLAKGNRLG